MLKLFSFAPNSERQGRSAKYSGNRSRFGNYAYKIDPDAAPRSIAGVTGFKLGKLAGYVPALVHYLHLLASESENIW